MSSVEDFFYVDTPQDDPAIQQSLARRSDLRHYRASLRETTPRKPGKFLKHQGATHKLISSYDSLLLINETGTGKTLVAAGAAEQFRKNSNELLLASDYASQYLYGRRSHISRTYVLVRGELLAQQFRQQLVCVGTDPIEYRDAPLTGTRTDRSRFINYKISQFYTIQGYVEFANSIKNKTDEELRREFSNSFFVVDEVHNIIGERNTPLKIKEQIPEESEGDQKAYDILHRLFHVAQNIKIMLMTATPMFNTPNELKYIMNLILPLKNQMRLNVTKASTADLRRYLNGYISYVRSPMTDYSIQEMGVVYKEKVREDLPMAQVIVWPSVMRGAQRKEYLASTSKMSHFYQDLRQYSNFSREFVQSKKPLPLEEHSCKAVEILKLMKDAKHCVYIFSNYKKFGVDVLAEILRSEGYEEYKEKRADVTSRYCDVSTTGDSINLEKKRRFLVVGEATPETAISLFNHPDNRYGEYIKIVMTSPIGREGLSFNNCTRNHLLDSHWNDGKNHQGKSRTIRVNSFAALAGEEFDVKIYNHVACPREMSPEEIRSYLSLVINSSIDGGTKWKENFVVDLFLYGISTAKQIYIDRTMTSVRQLAVDCVLHYERNKKRPNDPDSFEEFSCPISPPMPSEIRLSHLYDDELIALKELFRKRSWFSREDLMLAMGLDEYNLYQLVNHVIHSSIHLRNRLGMVSYLSYDNNGYYLSSVKNTQNLGLTADRFYSDHNYLVLREDFLFPKAIYPQKGDTYVGSISSIETLGEVPPRHRRYVLSWKTPLPLPKSLPRISRRSKAVSKEGPIPSFHPKDIFWVHDLFKFTKYYSNHGVSTIANEAGELRLWDNSLGLWRWATPLEQSVYQPEFNRLYEYDTAPMRDSPLFGMIEGDLFKIGNNISVFKADDKRAYSKGRAFHTLAPKMVIYISWWMWKNYHLAYLLPDEFQNISVEKMTRGDVDPKTLFTGTDFDKNPSQKNFESLLRDHQEMIRFLVAANLSEIYMLDIEEKLKRAFIETDLMVYI